MTFYWLYNWPFGMIFGSSDAKFQVELEDTKKCVHQKYPKDLDSNGKTDLTYFCLFPTEILQEKQEHLPTGYHDK